MKRLVICAALAGLCSPAAAQEAAVLEPSSGWLLDYGDESCSLVRNFGTGAALTRVQLTSYGSWVNPRVLVVGAAVPKLTKPSGELHYALLPEDIVVESFALQGQSGDSPAVSFGVRFAPYDQEKAEAIRSLSEWQERVAEPESPDADFEATVEGLRVVFDNDAAALFRLGNMGKPLAALRACVDDLQASWGLDPATQKARTRNATPDKSTYARVQRRYPSNMLRSGTGAFVPVRVMVSAAGEATRCVIQEQGIDKDFTDATCAGLMRLYRPALDAAGTPIDSVFHTAVVYQIGW